jgi:hypothetical protein
VVVSATSDDIRLDLVRIEISGRTPENLPWLRILRERVPAIGSQPIVGASLMSGGSAVALRFATLATDPLFAPVLDLVGEGGTKWAIRLAGELFVEQVLGALHDALNPPPNGAQIEDSPSASWNTSTGSWAAVGSAGIVQHDACKGLLWDTDVSVEIDVSLTPWIPESLDKLNLSLHVSTDASDWDTFRCWLGGASFLGLIPIAGIGLSIYGLVKTAEVIGERAGAAIPSSIGAGTFVKTNGGTSWTDYGANVPLPKPDPDHSWITDAKVDQRGVLVWGDFPIIPPDGQQAAFQPAPGNLGGSWSGHYECRTSSWVQEFGLDSIEITDDAMLGATRLARVPVSIFPTSKIEPAAYFAIDPSPIPLVDQWLSIETLVNPPAGTTGRLYLHTSAGIRRFDLGPVPAVPDQPSELELAIYKVGCFRWMVEWPAWMELKWLVDPPPDGLVGPAYRQWLIRMSHVRRGETFGLHLRRGDERLGAIQTHTTPQTGPLAFEVITGADEELAIEHDWTEPPVEIAMAERWLVPMTIVDAPIGAGKLVRGGSLLATAGNEHVLVYDLATGRQASIATGPDTQVTGIEDGILAWGSAGVLRAGVNGVEELWTRAVERADLDEAGAMVFWNGEDRLVIGRRELGVAVPRLQGSEAIDRPESTSLTLSGGRVAALVGGRLVIARPTPTRAQTLKG